MSEEHVVIPEHLKQNREALIQEMARIAADPVVLETAEQAQRDMSRLTAEDLLTTIGT